MLVTSASAVETQDERRPAGRSLVSGALRSITWRHAIWTAILGLLATFIFITISHAIGVFLFKSWSGRIHMFVQEFAILEVAAFTFLVCILTADQAANAGHARIRAYVAAVVVASILFAAVDTLIRYFFTDFFENAKPFWKPVHLVSVFMWTTMLGGFATFVYADLKRNRESAARLHAATLQRAQAARDVLQTRLQSMQARVEPQFLFDTLDRIGEIYERDPAKGQRTIDDLIAYLRIAMPQMHKSTSTLAREIELVHTYVAIAGACSDGRVRLTFEGNDDSPDRAFPPMLLLPLVEHAIASGRQTRPEDGAIELRTVKANGKLQITVGHGGNAFADDTRSEAIAQVRDHLATLFGAGAHLLLRKRSDRGTEIELEIPA